MNETVFFSRGTSATVDHSREGNQFNWPKLASMPGRICPRPCRSVKDSCMKCIASDPLFNDEYFEAVLDRHLYLFVMPLAADWVINRSKSWQRPWQKCRCLAWYSQMVAHLSLIASLSMAEPSHFTIDPCSTPKRGTQLQKNLIQR